MIDKNLVNILENISILLELKGENPFKARAYSNAGYIIKSQQIDVAKLVEENTLGNIKGFGKALQTKITDYVKNGKMSYYEKLKQEVPESLIELTKVEGIGPKKARFLYEQLGIKSIEELEKACEDNKLLELKGFGSKLQEKIINSIQHKKASTND